MKRAMAHPHFASLNPKERQWVEETGTLRDLDRNVRLIEETAPSEHVFFLLEGAVRVFHLASNAIELVLMFCKAPVMFGELETVLGISHIENVTTLEPSRLALLPKETFKRLLTSNPVFANQVLWDVCGKLAQASHNQKALAFHPLETRLATLLVSYAAFASKPVAGGLAINHLFTQEDMSNALGVSRRTVARTIDVWQEMGLLVRRKGRYVLLDLARLSELAAVEHIGLTYDLERGLQVLGAAPATAAIRPVR